jgi:hypothetical protein
VGKKRAAIEESPAEEPVESEPKPAKKPAKRSGAKKATKKSSPAEEPVSGEPAESEPEQAKKPAKKAGAKKVKEKAVIEESKEETADLSSEPEAQGKASEEEAPEEEAGEEKPEAPNPKKRESDEDLSEEGIEDEEGGPKKPKKKKDEEGGEAEIVRTLPTEITNVELAPERWVIKMRLDPEISEELKLVDLQVAFGSYMGIRKKFFEDLLTVAPNAKNYAVGKAIESVTGIDSDDWTKNSWLLVMAKELKNKAVYWLLFKRNQQMDGVLVAIGPEEFPKSILGLFSNDPESRNEYLKKINIWLTIEPAKWQNVAIFIPTWL